MNRRVEEVRQRTAAVSHRPTVACIEWLDPLIAAGHWIPEMVSVAGGVDALVEAGQPSIRLTFEQLAASSPDVLILMPCGMDVERAMQEFSVLGDACSWDDLPAVQQGRVYAVDSGALFSRSGPRLVDGLELMAKIIHPQLFTQPLDEKYGAQVNTSTVPH